MPTDTPTPSYTPSPNPTSTPALDFTIPLPTEIPNISLDTLWNNSITIILAVLGIAAFMGLVYSGVMMVTSGGDAAKFTQARKNIVWILIGILVVTLSYFILVAVYNSFNNGVLMPPETSTTAQPTGNPTVPAVTPRPSP